MNKQRVNDWILPAKKAIVDNGIPENGVIDKTYRSQIATFGAAVVMGSLKSAIAFFSEKNKSSVERPKLIQAMYQIITNESKQETKDIFQYVCDNDSYELVEQFTDASIALKLAFNFFDLVEDTKKYKDGKLIENSAITSVESQGDE